MDNYVLKELQNIRGVAADVVSRIDRLLVNVKGDPNDGQRDPLEEPDFPPFEPPETAERPARQPQSKQFEATPPSAIRDPLAKSLSDLVTPKQLGMIRALARDARVDHEDECRKVFKCATEELSKKAASSLIDHLTALKNQPGQRRAS